MLRADFLKPSKSSIKCDFFLLHPGPIKFTQKICTWLCRKLQDFEMRIEILNNFLPTLDTYFVDFYTILFYSFQDSQIQTSYTNIME